MMAAIMKVILLVNPSSGRGYGSSHGKRAADRLEKAGVQVQLVETPTFKQTLDRAEGMTTRDCDVVVAVGGDGTAHAVANGLCRSPSSTRPAMGVVPCGRGNDFAVSLGVEELPDACSAIVAGKRRRIDVGKTEEGYFLGVAGAGFDSKVARRAQRQVPLLSGSAVYTFALLRTLTDFKPIPARVTYDSGVFEGPMMFAVVGNNDRYGGGMRITPHASMFDGVLDLCLVKEVSRTTLLWVFPKVFRGTHLEHPQVFYTQTKRLTIESTEPAELFADGEFLQSIPARIQVVPGELEVIVGSHPTVFSNLKSSVVSPEQERLLRKEASEEARC
jgi:diacylglycerol kinase (ATP)